MVRLRQLGSDPETGHRSDATNHHIGTRERGFYLPGGIELSDSSATRVGIVILNWNNLSDTRNCLSSILRQDTGADIVPIVVDNGSLDGSPDAIEREFPNVLLLRNDANEGFARACNRGARYAREARCTHVVFLNNDAWLHPSAVDRAVGALRRENADLLSGRIYESPDSQILSYAGGSLNRFLGRATVPAEHRRERASHSRSGPTKFVTCAFLVLPMSTIDRIGFLPEDYFFGTEEWDYSLRARQAGLKLWYEASSICWHPGASTHQTSRPMYVYSGYRNKLIFQHRYLPHWAWPVWRTLFRLYVITAQPALRRRLHSGTSSAESLRACALQALEDHHLGRRVEREDLERIEALYGT